MSHEATEVLVVDDVRPENFVPPQGDDANDDADLQAIVDRFVDDMAPVVEAYCMQPRDIATALQENFRASFKFSTGSPFLQAVMQARVCRLLTFNGAEPAEIAAIAVGLEPDMSQLRIPYRHASPRKPHRVEPRVRGIWRFYMDICQHPDDPEMILPQDKMGAKEIEIFADLCHTNMIPFQLAGEMFLQEYVYMAKGRPKRDSTASRYRSLVRECGLLGKPTGTPEFDVILAEVGSVARIMHDPTTVVPKTAPELGGIRRVIGSLASKWELRNESPFFV